MELNNNYLGVCEVRVRQFGQVTLLAVIVYRRMSNNKRKCSMFFLEHEVLKEMSELIFQDKKLEIYRDFLIIKDYYAPKLDKKLRISDIENVWVENLTFLGGKYRLWGTGTFLRWFPFHLERSSQDKALVVRRKSGLIKSTKITLDTQDPLKACELIYNLLH